MPLQHASTKVPGQPLAAIVDWNANHVITGGVLDIGANNFIVDTNVLFVHAGTDRVGIGITTPQENLHIHQSDSAENLIRFTNLTTGPGPGDGSYIGIGSDEIVRLWNRENLALQLGTNNIARMTILANGNVGIGETNPGRTFEMVSAAGIDIAYWRGGTNDAGSTFLIRNSDGTDLFDLCADGDLYLKGNVGIGTTGPGGKLDVVETANAQTPSAVADTLVLRSGGHGGISILTGNAEQGGIYFADTDDPDIARIIYDHNVEKMKFYINNIVDAVVIDNLGHMGIGAPTPGASALLELSSTTGALLLTRMTTAQRNALTAVNGMIIYNSSTNKIEGREAGAWVEV